MNKDFVTFNFFNNDCSLQNKYRIDGLGKEIRIFAVGLLLDSKLNYNALLKDVELQVTDEYGTNLKVYCDVFYNKEENSYTPQQNGNACSIDAFLVDFADSHGFDLTKYTTPFLAMVDLDYNEKYHPEKLSEEAKLALITARQMGFNNLGDLSKNGNERQKSVISNILKNKRKEKHKRL